MSDLEQQCWQLHVRGQSAWQIAQACEVPVEEVELLLQRRLAANAQRPSVPLRGHVEKLIDEVNEIRQAAWGSFDRSKVEKVKTVEKHTKGGTQDGKSEDTISKETKEGDSPFLRILLDCNHRESLLRGIERPTRLPVRSMQPKLDIDALLEQVEAANGNDSLLEMGDTGER